MAAILATTTTAAAKVATTPKKKAGGRRPNNKKKKDDDEVMPRPHRLGLGAIPKAQDAEEAAPSTRRGLRPDQLQQKKRLEQQQQDYQRQREQKIAQDKQRTMQNGSLVLMRPPSSRRACILQLVGVPGLNMVRVQFEKETTESIVKRGDIERLLSRDELDRKPFQLMKIAAREELNKSRSSDDDIIIILLTKS